jgi:hypothetical protein
LCKLLIKEHSLILINVVTQVYHVAYAGCNRIADSFGEQFSDTLLYLFVDLLLDDILRVCVRVIKIFRSHLDSEFEVRDGVILLLCMHHLTVMQLGVISNAFKLSKQSFMWLVRSRIDTIAGLGASFEIDAVILAIEVDSIVTVVLGQITSKRVRIPKVFFLVVALACILLLVYLLAQCCFLDHGRNLFAGLSAKAVGAAHPS